MKCNFCKFEDNVTKSTDATEPLDLSSFCMRSGKSHIGYGLLLDAVRSGMDFNVAYKKIFNTESPTKMFVSVECLNSEQEQRILEMSIKYDRSEDNT